jgi:hypothetical protein
MRELVLVLLECETRDVPLQQRVDSPPLAALPPFYLIHLPFVACYDGGGELKE